MICLSTKIRVCVFNDTEFLDFFRRVYISTKNIFESESFHMMKEKSSLGCFIKKYFNEKKNYNEQNLYKKMFHRKSF